MRSQQTEASDELLLLFPTGRSKASSPEEEGWPLKEVYF
jgi:hypothetical protein